MHYTDIEKNSGEIVSGKLFGKYSGLRSFSMVLLLLANLLLLLSAFIIHADLHECFLILFLIDIVVFLLYLVGTDDSAVYYLSKDSVTIQSKRKSLRRSVKWEDIQACYPIVASIRAYTSLRKMNYFCLVIDTAQCLHTKNCVNGIQLEDLLSKWVKDPYCVVLPRTEETEQFVQDRMSKIQRMVELSSIIQNNREKTL